MSHFQRLLLAILLGAVQPGIAMQLGSSKGSAVYGRPLDLTVPVRFDAPIEDPIKCFSADIFQADTKFDAGRVRLDVTPAANGLDAVVRIRSNSAVIEPWAKVILRNNCGIKITRQYDFLTDFAADVPVITSQMESAAANNLPNASNVGSTTTQQNVQTATVSNTLPILPGAPVSNWSVQRAQASAQTSTQAVNQASAQALAKPRRTVKPKAIEPMPTAISAAPTSDLGKVDQLGQSRLKMETFELTDEHQVLLKLSTAMIAPSGMRTPEEIQALAQATAVWRAINGMPALPAATLSPTAPPAVTPNALASLQAKPTEISKDGIYEFNNSVVYGLMGLLALTLACLAWLWFRVRQGSQIGSQPGYDWLEEPALTDTPVQEEPPQVSQRWSTDTAFVPEDQVVEFVERSSAEHKKSSEKQLVPVNDASPVAALPPMKETFTLHEGYKSSQINAKEKVTKVFSAANPSEKSPEHFDDSRFDKGHLVTKFNTSLVHDIDLNTLNVSVDFVVPEVTPKLRSVPSPVEVVDSETELEQSPALSEAISPKPQQTATKFPKKEEANAAKGAMIDFDVFADHVPLRRPSRFGS